METKTASETLKETFNSVYRAIQNYCEWVQMNILILELHESLINKRNDNEFMEDIPRMILRLRL